MAQVTELHVIVKVPYPRPIEKQATSVPQWTQERDARLLALMRQAGKDFIDDADCMTMGFAAFVIIVTGLVSSL